MSRIFIGSEAVAEAEKIIESTRPYFKQTNIHYIANLDNSVRKTDQDEHAHISFRADSEAKTNIALLRIAELGFSHSLYLSDSDFLAGVSTQAIDWTKPIQIAYSGGKSSTTEGIRCLLPIICDLRSINYSNSGVTGRVLGWNKYLSTTILQSNGIPTPRSWLFKKKEGWISSISPESGIDLIIKNNTEAWGLGVSNEPVLKNKSIQEVEEECIKICDETYLDELIVQEFIEGPEIYTPVFKLFSNYLVFTPMEIKIKTPEWSVGRPIGFKLNTLKKHYFQPFSSAKISHKISKIAAEAMEWLNIDIISRMDFRIDSLGTPRLFDMAEVPGLGEGHAISQSLKASGANFDAWELMLALNIQRILAKKTSMEASVLSG
ncbi:hypothetical protein [Maridesulfovibrio sp.]|uniref:hypothetical protein n=1 Tax=Maridesulfovibrio sp. TaxID=2795000 RepID=UPI002AA725EF|nr:hypothetical protein [Maridesulfovibrio sp.]